ncbi:MAG: Ig-like domain-containing protein [Lachnospiraceae bacterium]|nr:Ig-like domain-containing protein [Lachnospiraceae bacterium]
MKKQLLGRMLAFVLALSIFGGGIFINNSTNLAYAAGEREEEIGENIPGEIAEVVYQEKSSEKMLIEDFTIQGFVQENPNLIYTGEEITQDITIYHNETLLKEGTDYTICYRNNVNASAYDALEAPSITITMKGQYEGSRTLYFSIYPRDIVEADGASSYQQAIEYGAEEEIPEPTLFYKNKPLVLNRDFICDYSSLPEELEVGENYSYEVRGIGNFTGSFYMDVVVLANEAKDVSKAEVKLDADTYAYDGDSLKDNEVTVQEVTIDGMLLEPTYYQWRVEADKPGIGYVYLLPSEQGKAAGYYGRKAVKITLVGDRKLKDTSEGNGWCKEIIFSKTKLDTNGGIYQEGTNLLVFEGENGTEELVEGRDYSIRYGKAKEAGEVKVIFTGQGRYTGTLEKMYSILPNTQLEVFWPEYDEDTTETFLPIEEVAKLTWPYRKEGAIPEIELRDEMGNVLDKGVDYTLRTKNNRNIGTMTLEVVGKGNYQGYQFDTFVEVVPADIAEAIMIVEDQVYTTDLNAWKAPVVIKDSNGNRLVAGRDYETTIEYTYQNPEGEQRPVPLAGTTVNVTVTGKNNYQSTLEGSYRICGKLLSNCIIEIDHQIFNGSAITLKKSDIRIYIDASAKQTDVAVSEDQFEIVGYENNDRVGTAKVILKGKGTLGGQRTCSFTIAKDSFQMIRVEKLEFVQKEVKLQPGESKQLKLNIFPENAENKTIIWTSSDEKVATVDKNGNVTAKREGMITIKAVSQDSKKAANCTVKINYIPVEDFELNQTRVEGFVGTTFQLEVLDVQPEEIKEWVAEWESSDDAVVSVDDTGLLTLHQPGVAIITVSMKESEAVRKCIVWVKNENDTLPEGSYLTPQEFREADDLDDTASFNRAINKLQERGCDTLFVPEGTYQIDAITGIRLKNNMKLIMSPNAVLQALPNSATHYNVIKVSNISGTIIRGGQIRGERDTHSGSVGEWGMGIGVRDSDNIIISDVKISNCWGDGIYIGSNNDNDVNLGCDEIIISNCVLDHNRRNNLSIVNGDDVTVDNCTFTNAKGTAPEYGIDIETNNQANPCERIMISNSTFEGNGSGCLGIITAANDVTISKCIMKGMVYNLAGTNVTISDCEVYDELYARIGVTLLNTTINAGTAAEDTLVASFEAGTDNYVIGKYNLDSANAMLVSYMDSYDSPSGKVLRMERTSTGNKETGYTLSLTDLLINGNIKLDAGCNYRFEYVTRGSGVWGVKTTQNGWYPCEPQNDKFTTGMTFYEVTDKGAPYNMIFFAKDMTKGMFLEIDSIKIYKVN